MISIAVAISELAPGAEWSIDDEDYATLVWNSPDIPQPSYEEVQAKLDELKADAPRKAIRSIRAAAYSSEADPLFFKAQRGEATLEEWQAKVEEIRNRYPYPEVTASRAAT